MAVLPGWPVRLSRVRAADAGRQLEAPRIPRSALLVAAGLAVLVAAFGARYGYHRDELYFIEAGRHPAWGYPDQPPLVPLLAAGWDAVTGGRLFLFRLVPAAVAGLVVAVAARSAAWMGLRGAEITGTAVLTAGCTFLIAMGHLFSTSTFTLLFTAGTVALLLRALDAGTTRAWLGAGFCAGLAMQVQVLPALTLLSCLAGLLVAGPRAPLRRRGPWLAAAVAAVIAAPYLVWQAAHGWPQLDVAAGIAAGDSTSSADRWQVVPFQALMVGPLIAPVLVAGVVALLRSARFRAVRWIGVAYLVLLALVTLTGGKPYYASVLVPPVMAAGVTWGLGWARAGWRRGVAAVALSAHAVGAVLICLPVAPAPSAVFDLANAVNPDTGETVGWDAIVRQVAEVARQVPGPSTAVLTLNYGEAGALDRARRQGVRLPPVYSGHNAYGGWGPPAESVTTVVAVGDFYDSEVGTWFAGCRVAGRLDTGVDDEEDGLPIRICTGLRRSWARLWPSILRTG